MLDKKTDDMLKDLRAADSFECYLEDNQAYLLDGTLSSYLTRLLEQQGMTKGDVLRRAEINDIYGYQIFAGTRKPSREKLVAICIGLQLSLEQTQQLLKATGFAPLYAKNKRDSIFIYGIGKQLSVCDINGLLYDCGEKTME